MQKLLFLFVALVVTQLECTANPMPETPQNFILYIADDQAIDDYGVYGNPKVHTPAVDRLASEGIRFTRTYTAQAICAPSRSVLYSGNYPVKNGAYMNHMGLRPGQTSLVETLQELGYKVILAGKSHVGPDEAFPWTERWHEIDDESITDGGQSKRLPLEQISEFIRTETEPYCLIIASALPHSPYPEIKEASAEDVVLDPKTEPTERNIRKRLAYYENIRRDNAQLEVVLEAVDESPRKDDTLFLYTADHGFTGKYSVYDLGLRMPMVIRWPKLGNEAQVSDALISFTDVLPTFIDIAGGNLSGDRDGLSFLNVLNHTGASHREYTYGVSEHQNIWIPSIFPSRMVTDGRWKYIRNFNAYEIHEQNFGENEAFNGFIRAGAEKNKDTPYEELYDLESDPYEQNNLIKDSGLTDTKQRLIEELYRWMKNQGDYLGNDAGLVLFQPTHIHLDRTNKLYSPPEGLENSLTEADYSIP